MVVSMKPHSVGVFTPIKSDTAPNAIVDELLSKKVVTKLYALLDATDEITYTPDLDLRQAIIENGKVYVGDVCLSDLDLFFWYYLPHYKPSSFEFKVLDTLKKQTIVVPDPDGFVTSLDKFTAHTVLRNSGLPTPDFALFEADDISYAKNLFNRWGSLLLKPRFGKFGHGILKVDSESMFRDAIAYSASQTIEPTPIFVERFEENDPEKWISATTIGGNALFGYRKRAHKFVDGWKVYDEAFQGGEADYVDPEPVRGITETAAKVLGADVVGFDCIFTTQGKYVIVDENTFPGIYEDCFAKSGRGDLAENFYTLILKKLDINFST